MLITKIGKSRIGIGESGYPFGSHQASNVVIVSIRRYRDIDHSAHM